MINQRRTSSRRKIATVESVRDTLNSAVKIKNKNDSLPKEEKSLSNI